MITIISKKNYLEVSGHAYASGRNDIVCAAVSAVVCASYIKWKNNKNFSLYEDPKKPSVSFLIKELDDKINITEHIEFDFFVFLIKQIFLSYPQNICWLDN